jgi:hypothetical protein
MSLTNRQTQTKFEQILPEHGNVLFTRSPSATSTRDLGMATQKRSWDSDAVIHTHQKTGFLQATYNLSWKFQPTVVTDALYSFLKFANGNKRLFGYVDHDGTWHDVYYLSKSLEIKRAGVEMYSIQLQLLEPYVLSVMQYPVAASNSILGSDGLPLFDGDSTHVIIS